MKKAKRENLENSVIFFVDICRLLVDIFTVIRDNVVV